MKGLTAAELTAGPADRKGKHKKTAAIRSEIRGGIKGLTAAKFKAGVGAIWPGARAAAAHIKQKVKSGRGLPLFFRVKVDFSGKNVIE